MLTDHQISAYFEDGYLLVEDVLTADALQTCQEITYQFIEKSRGVSASNDVFDLDDGHSADAPKLTRIKLPHKQHPFFWEVLKGSRMTEVLRQLVGPNAVLQTSKLNAKAPGGGAAVEWHQDWAFYPHTNDDMLAFGVFLEDVTEENGPLQVIPGSHKGPVLSHNGKDGVFCGAVDPDDPDFHPGEGCHDNRQGWVDVDPSCTHAPWLCPEPFRSCAADAVLRMLRGGCLAADGRIGLFAALAPAGAVGGFARPGHYWCAGFGAAHDGCAGKVAVAPGGRCEFDLSVAEIRRGQERI